MKTLTILRHGKAVRSEEYPVDFDRPLARRGEKDIARISKVLRQSPPTIDWIISSPASRARQTAEIVAERLDLQDQLIWEPVLYESGVESLLSVIERFPVNTQHALIVGHNPTLEQTVSGLCAGSVSRMANSLPTAGVANIELQIMWWESGRWVAGLVRLYRRPRLLRGL